jgi:hypothetical protein
MLYIHRDKIRKYMSSIRVFPVEDLGLIEAESTAAYRNYGANND